ncbi:MAG: hypothetical protein MUD07_08970, partial [Burkholderiaceae bacterium]|nr:hypothetical protein [Burkholderiaceae bacterium]
MQAETENEPEEHARRGLAAGGQSVDDARAGGRAAARRSDGRLCALRVQQVVVPALPRYRFVVQTRHGRPDLHRLATDGLIFIDASRGRETFSAVQQRWQQSADPLRGIYLEFAGYVENGRVSALDLQRALGWVESCAQRPTNVAAGTRLWAAGNEPGWNFVVGPRTAVWRTPDGEVELPLRPLQHSGDTVAYDA